MSDSLWQRVEDIFHRAVELAPGARSAFLDEACAGDQSLRQEVESLLAYESEDGATFVGPAGDEAPRTIAHYRISGKLGQGGMGTVYRATDTKLGREVAIKVLPGFFAEDAERMARFTREAKVLASLNHPNIAQIYGIEERALVMELVPGETLKGPLPCEIALNYAKQIAEALEAAHEKGIVHRDLKPANIVVTPEGVVKVLDFGLAAVTPGSLPDAGSPVNTPTLTMRVTQAGMIMGTAAYMSPEQARGQTVDRRADIWAFGCVLFELLTGDRAFQGESVGDTLAAVMNEEPDWQRAPEQARRLLRACLEKDPKRRLRDIGDAWRMLEAGAPAALLPATRIGGRFGSAAWIAVAVLSVAFIAAVVVLWPRAADHPLIRLSADFGPDALAGANITAAISPDGTRLVFLQRSQGGEQMLATRLLDQAGTTVLAGTENGRDPFFSPDGQWVGFFADGKLKKAPVEGGIPVTVCDAPNARGADWGEDGDIVLSQNLLGGLSRVSAAGGTPQAITTPADSARVTDRWPQILPGGDAILFTSNSIPAGFDNANIEAVSLKTRERKTVLKGGYFGRYLPAGRSSGFLVYINQGVLYGAPFDPSRLEIQHKPTPVLENVAGSPTGAGGQLGFSRTGTLVYLSGKAPDSVWPVVWLDAFGKTRPLISTPGAYYTPRLSPDGQRLAVALATSRGAEITIYDSGRGTMVPLTSGGQRNFQPVWTPDGKHVVFWTTTSTGSVLQWVRADGAGQAQTLMESKGFIVPNSFSPDGRRLAYFAPAAQTGYDIWTLPLDMADPEHPKPGMPEAFLRGPSNELLPAFSPDGRWIAYTTDASGTRQVYVRPFPGPGGQWPISSTGGQMSFWSRVGRQLFYKTLDNHIMVVDYTVRGDVFIAAKPRLWTPTELRETGTMNLDLAPDGKRFAVFPMPQEKAGENGPVRITFLLNFIDELRRRVPSGK